MAHVNTMYNTQQTYTIDQLKLLAASGQLDTSKVANVSVFNASADISQCTDGKDDGKIGFAEAAGCTVKGAVTGLINGIKGCFTDENGDFSLLSTLKTAATVGACFIPGVGPVIAGGLCAYGAVKGGVGLAKGIAAAANADTDGQAKAAFESIGGNALTTGLSIAGLKASTNAIAANAKAASAEGVSAYESATSTFGKVKGLYTDAKAGMSNYYGSAWKTAAEGKTYADMTKGEVLSTAGKVAKQAAKDTGVNLANAAHSTSEKIKEHTPDFLKRKQPTTQEQIAQANQQAANSLPKDLKALTEGDGTVSLKGKVYETLDDIQHTLADTAVGKKAGEIKTTVSGKIDSAKQAYSGAVEAGYQGLPTTGGNIKLAGLATTSSAMGDYANTFNGNIDSANQRYATITTQKGYQYDLLDYTTISQDELNQRYAQIVKQSRFAM